MMEEKVVVHHIGARGPTQAFPISEKLDGSIINVLYDADDQSIEEIERVNRERKAKVIIVNRCIAGKNGVRTFCDSHHEYGSSLLEANPEFATLSIPAHWIDYDYTVYEAISAKSRRELETITLDDLIASEIKIPLPDFLSLDTQGSELEILKGSPTSVNKALCIVTEVEFIGIYDKQPLFGEIFTYLLNKNYFFAKFYPILSGSFYRGPIGLRGEGLPVTTDALFLRNPEIVAKECGDDICRHIALWKLAFFSIVFGFIEHALWALKLDEYDSTCIPIKFAGEAWYEFVKQFKRVVETYPVLMPDTYAERHIGNRPLGRIGFEKVVRSQLLKLENSFHKMRRLLEVYEMEQAVTGLERQTGICLQRLGLPGIAGLKKE